MYLLACLHVCYQPLLSTSGHSLKFKATGRGQEILYPFEAIFITVDQDVASWFVVQQQALVHQFAIKMKSNRRRDQLEPNRAAVLRFSPRVSHQWVRCNGLRKDIA
jgi:hypothetical protein